MKKLIVAILLLFVLVLSAVSCSCDSPAETSTTSDSTAKPAETQKEPIYDTDDRWSPLQPMT